MRLFAYSRTLACGVTALLLLFAASGNTQAQQQWGTVKGQIVYGGDKIPTRPMLNVDKDKAVCLAKGPLLSEDWVVDPKTKGIKWVYVWLIPDSTNRKDWSKPIPIHPSLIKKKLPNLVVDQPCCAFDHYAIALQDGQSITMKNTMSISHNVKVDGKESERNPSLNQIIPPRSEIKIGPFHTTKGLGGIPVACNIHMWMKARIRVFSHPYFFVTSADGKFVLKDAPAGKYRLVMYHEGAGFFGGKKGKEMFGTPIEIKPGPSDKPTDLGTFKVMK